MNDSGTRAIANKVLFTAQQLSQLSMLNSDGGYASPAAVSLLATVHALPVVNGYTNITVVGNGGGTVTVVGMQVVKRCQAPLTGSLVVNGQQGGNDTIELLFDLDSPVNNAQDVNGQDYFESRDVTLAPGEVQTFSVRVRTYLHYCQFTFQLTIATPDGQVTETIDDNGKPFELTAIADGSAQAPYSRYTALYVGGLDAKYNPTLNDPSGHFVAVDPKTFRD
jgi:hypothetical protein